MRTVVVWVRFAICLAGLAACSADRDRSTPDDGGPGDVAQGGDAAPQGGDAAVGGPALSCVDLPATCGVGNNDSCCNSPVVPGGMYYRSYDKSETSSWTKDHPATVGTFRLDKYEVTVARFRAFVKAGMGTRLAPPLPGAGARLPVDGSGWEARWNEALASSTAELVALLKCDAALQTWTDDAGANENRPMNCITWYEAAAFCAWDSGFLPTEAEWNYAAAGGAEQRAYPWSVPPESLTPVDRAHASYDCAGDGVAGCLVADLLPVGASPAGDGRWGHSDLSGNVFERTLDWYGEYPKPCSDCARLTPSGSTLRIVRGGSFRSFERLLRTGERDRTSPDARDATFGVRCARLP